VIHRGGGEAVRAFEVAAADLKSGAIKVQIHYSNPWWWSVQ
jgi:hypothetical protein